MKSFGKSNELIDRICEVLKSEYNCGIKITGSGCGGFLLGLKPINCGPIFEILRVFPSVKIYENIILDLKGVIRL